MTQLKFRIGSTVKFRDLDGEIKTGQVTDKGRNLKTMGWVLRVDGVTLDADQVVEVVSL